MSVYIFYIWMCHTTEKETLVVYICFDFCNVYETWDLKEDPARRKFHKNMNETKSGSWTRFIQSKSFPFGCHSFWKCHGATKRTKTTIYAKKKKKKKNIQFVNERDEMNCDTENPTQRANHIPVYCLSSFEYASKRTRMYKFYIILLYSMCVCILFIYQLFFQEFSLYHLFIIILSILPVFHFHQMFVI